MLNLKEICGKIIDLYGVDYGDNKTLEEGSVEDVLHTSVDVAPLLLEERKEQTNNSNL